MLNLTGQCMSGESAVDFLEMLPDNIPDEIKDEEFCDEYERMLNRVRYEVKKSVPVAPKVYENRFTEYGCGSCGHNVSYHNDYCPKCGRKIGWSSLRKGGK